MRITKLLLICMCCLIVSPAVWGQASRMPSKPGILGYLDPNTGAFRPVPPASEEGPDPAAATTFTGTITVTLTITLKTAGLTNVICSADTFVFDSPATGGRSYTESDTVAAGPLVNGKRTCTLTIPYAWGLFTQSGDSMQTSYFVSGSAGTTGLPQRSSSLTPLDTRKVPANGTITALTANVTL